MATFTIQLAIGAQTFTYTESPTNANAQRIGPAYRARHNRPAATDAEIWEILGRGVANSIKSAVLEAERAVDEAAFVPTPFP